MEEPGGLQSLGSLRVQHGWATSLSLFTFMHWRRKWQPTPVILPGESQGRGSLVGCRLWGHRVGHDWSDLAAAGKTCLWVRAGIQEKLAPILHDCFLWPFLTHYNILSLILVGICFLWPVNLVNFIVLSSYLSAAAAKSLQSCPILCDP